MNLNSLRYFIEVAGTKSFTNASKNLFISQPGISQQIHLLEKQLGVSLLHRTTRKVELTEEGKYLYDKTHSSFNEIENTLSYLIDSSTFPTLISVATIPSAASLYLPKLLKNIHIHYPEIEFNIKETNSTDVLNLVKDRTCHLGFIRTTTNSKITENHGFNYIEFKPSPIKVAVSSKHKLAPRKTIKIEELRNEFFLHYNPIESTALYDLVEEVGKDAGFKPKTICTGSELLTISNIISNNLAVTLIPNDMLKLVPSENIKAIDLEDIHLESSIVAVWKDDGYLNLNTKLLIKELSKLKKETD